MNTVRIKKGDNVRIMAGKDSGKSGIVESVSAATGRVMVKGLNMYKKHVKPSRKYPTGGIIDINKSIDVSNVMLICPNCGKMTRVAYDFENQSKIRICKKCSKSVEGGAK